MIFPRSRARQHRYMRRKLIAIVITFGVGWLFVKFLPESVLPERWTAGGAATPREAFRGRQSDVWVRAEAVVEKIQSDSLDAAGDRGLRRWRMRSTAGHPFTLLQDPVGGLLRAQPGDTVSVRGTYRWDTSGGTVLASREGPGR